MQKIFFSADHHFNHDNIIKYCNRPFNNIDDMNEELIKKWNEKISKGDLIYYLGDLSWSRWDILDRLNGQIYLIKGSHDRIRKPIANIIKIRHLLNFRIEKKPLSLCHYCMRVWHLSHYNSYMLYGHSHCRLKAIGKSWDVGVDGNNFYPYEWDEIKTLMKNRPDNFNLIKKSS